MNGTELLSLDFPGPNPGIVTSLWCNGSGWDTYHRCLYVCRTYLLAHIMALVLAEEAVRDFKMTGYKCPSGIKGHRDRRKQRPEKTSVTNSNTGEMEKIVWEAEAHMPCCQASWKEANMLDITPCPSIGKEKQCNLPQLQKVSVERKQL